MSTVPSHSIMEDDDYYVVESEAKAKDDNGSEEVTPQRRSKRLKVKAKQEGGGGKEEKEEAKGGEGMGMHPLASTLLSTFPGLGLLRALPPQHQLQLHEEHAECKELREMGFRLNPSFKITATNPNSLKRGMFDKTQVFYSACTDDHRVQQVTLDAFGLDGGDLENSWQNRELCRDSSGNTKFVTVRSSLVYGGVPSDKIVPHTAVLKKAEEFTVNSLEDIQEVYSTLPPDVSLCSQRMHVLAESDLLMDYTAKKAAGGDVLLTSESATDVRRVMEVSYYLPFNIKAFNDQQELLALGIGADSVEKLLDLKYLHERCIWRNECSTFGTTIMFDPTNHVKVAIETRTCRSMSPCESYDSHGRYINAVSITLPLSGALEWGILVINNKV